MRASQKSGRSRGKSSRKPQSGNIINRVFDSAGPEGKVRGTPQQIIEKYETLARDAQTSGDRVIAENFLQHAEHYTRMLSAAIQERDAQQQQRRDGQPDQQSQPRQDGFAAAQPNGGGNGPGGLGMIDPGEMEQPDLVATPESRQKEQAQAEKAPRQSRRRPRPPRKADGGDGEARSGSQPDGPTETGGEVNA